MLSVNCTVQVFWCFYLSENCHKVLVRVISHQQRLSEHLDRRILWTEENFAVYIHKSLFQLKGTVNEKQEGSGRWQLFDKDFGPWRSTFVYLLQMLLYGETWPRSSSTRVPETCMSRPVIEPTTCCTAGDHSSQELLKQLMLFGTSTIYMAAPVYGTQTLRKEWKL